MEKGMNFIDTIIERVKAKCPGVEFEKEVKLLSEQGLIDDGCPGRLKEGKATHSIEIKEPSHDRFLRFVIISNNDLENINIFFIATTHFWGSPSNKFTVILTDNCFKIYKKTHINDSEDDDLNSPKEYVFQSQEGLIDYLSDEISAWFLNINSKGDKE